MMTKRIAVAGATGNLGKRISKALKNQGPEVLALVRTNTAEDKVADLRGIGVMIEAVDMSNSDDVARALEGTSCLVSALQGLRDVIVDTQAKLLTAAIKAGVPRLIPSDYSRNQRERIGTSIFAASFTPHWTKLPSGARLYLTVPSRMC